MLLFPVTLVCEKNNVLYKWGKEERAGWVHWLRRSTLFHTITGHREPGGGVLPYITYTSMCRPTGSWFWSSWFRTGYPFQRRFLERGIIFRTHESSSFVSSYLKLFKDRLLLKIRFNARVNKQTVVLLLHPERSIKNWPISRTWWNWCLCDSISFIRLLFHKQRARNVNALPCPLTAKFN